MKGKACYFILHGSSFALFYEDVGQVRDIAKILTPDHIPFVYKE
jgi:hypothetical protein